MNCENYRKKVEEDAANKTPECDAKCSSYFDFTGVGALYDAAANNPYTAVGLGVGGVLAAGLIGRMTKKSGPKKMMYCGVTKAGTKLFTYYKGGSLYCGSRETAEKYS